MAKIQGSKNRGTKSAVIAGGAAGAHTVTGIKVGDDIHSVINTTDGADLTSEFAAVAAADTIDNTGGTDTSGDSLTILYSDSN